MHEIPNGYLLVNISFGKFAFHRCERGGRKSALFFEDIISSDWKRSESYVNQAVAKKDVTKTVFS